MDIRGGSREDCRIWGEGLGETVWVCAGYGGGGAGKDRVDDQCIYPAVVANGGQAARSWKRHSISSGHPSPHSNSLQRRSYQGDHGQETQVRGWVQLSQHAA